MSENETKPASQIARLFDIRLIVGGLLSIYGIILLIKGAVDPKGDVTRTQAAAHVNLWTGVGMLVVGLVFLAWMRLRPLQPPNPDELQEDTGPAESRAQ